MEPPTFRVTSALTQRRRFAVRLPGGSGADHTGSANDTGTDTDTGTDADGPWVFVTSGAWSGDLAGAGGEADGLAGADALCNAAANAGGLPGRYDAWLSTNEIDAVDRIQGEGPWYQVGTGLELFSNRSALSGTPREGIDRDEYGDSSGGLVWTGTLTGGRVGEAYCSLWAGDSAGNDGLTGEAFSDTNWTDLQARGCDEDNSLYCFQR